MPSSAPTQSLLSDSPDPGARLRRGPHRVAWHHIFMVFAVALALRAGWGLYRMEADGASVLEFPDEEQYWLMARSLHNGKGLQDELGFRAGRMPLYPGLLSLVAGSAEGPAVAKVAQWYIGAMGAVFALVLGTRVGGRSIGLMTGLIVAADPFLVFFSNLVLTETLFVTLLVALWSCGAGIVAERRRPGVRNWLMFSVIGLACIYARESTVALIGVALAAYLVWQRFTKSALVGVLLVGSVVVAGLFPWAWRNSRVIGEWCWLTTRAGISLYDGVGPRATGAADLGDVKNSDAVRDLQELEYNRYFLDASHEAMRAEPWRIAKLALHKFMRMWNPFPNVADYRAWTVRLVSAAWMVPLLLLALAGVFVLSKAATSRAGALVVYLLLPSLYLSALHMVFVGSIRYRLGAMPMLSVLAAVALTHYWDAIRSGNRRTPLAEAQRLQR